MMGLGMLGGMFLFWFVLIGLAVLLVRGLFQSNQKDHSGPANAPLSAQEILDQRYARGEITQEQYLQMVKDIHG